MILSGVIKSFILHTLSTIIVYTYAGFPFEILLHILYTEVYVYYNKEVKSCWGTEMQYIPTSKIVIEGT